VARQRRLLCHFKEKDTCNTLQFLARRPLFCQCIGSRRHTPAWLIITRPRVISPLRPTPSKIFYKSGLIVGRNTWRYLRPSVLSRLLLSFPTNYLPTLQNAAMLSSLASQLPSVSSSISSPAATSTAITESAKQLAWQAALYLVIALGIVICYPEPLRYYEPPLHPP